MIATAVSLTSVRRRLDAIAIDHLRAEVARLATENDELRTQLAWAEDDAESWRRDATDMHLQLCELHCGSPGITMAGELVVVPSSISA
jgi:hypothetical protein